eukprot:531324-Rhodomonas_salina.2
MPRLGSRVGTPRSKPQSSKISVSSLVQPPLSAYAKTHHPPTPNAINYLHPRCDVSGTGVG